MTNLAYEQGSESNSGHAQLQKYSAQDLASLNQELESMTAQKRVGWALENLPGSFILSSSFGAQSAVMLHMLTQQYPDIPVVLTDTGYLFPETYQFIDQMTERLNLNLQVFRAPISPAWQEAKFGKLWSKVWKELNSIIR